MARKKYFHWIYENGEKKETTTEKFIDVVYRNRKNLKVHQTIDKTEYYVDGNIIACLENIIIMGEF